MPRLPVAVGVAREHGAAVLRLGRRAWHAAGAVGLHQRSPVRLLVVRHAHHEDLHVDAEQGAGEGQRRAPLARAGLGGDLPDAGFLVVEGLGHRRVRLVAARRAHALVLVVDAGGRLERLLEAARAEQRRRTPLPVDVAHGPGDLDLALRRDLLLDERHREQRREVVGAERLAACPDAAAADGGDGRSAAMLYQAVGSCDSSITNFTRSVMRPPSGRADRIRWPRSRHGHAAPSPSGVPARRPAVPGGGRGGVLRGPRLDGCTRAGSGNYPGTSWGIPQSRARS